VGRGDDTSDSPPLDRWSGRVRIRLRKRRSMFSTQVRCDGDVFRRALNYIKVGVSFLFRNEGSSIKASRRDNERSQAHAVAGEPDHVNLKGEARR
jgi:hypothetical protein